MRIIAFITEAVVIRRILGHLGEQTSPPVVKPARGPPLWEMHQDGQAETGWPRAIDPHTQASPADAAKQIPLGDEFDQRIAC